ncbi:MAG: phenylacetate-CoA oxygenase subunit PaaJ, partial [Proteobacteria bacterium]|nr:phenylacetate-CoA oxygenase subunit PaaJ [Pseudomonadota bacterium]
MEPAHSVEQIWRWLDEVKDPEIPVISLVELGIVRDVRIDDQTTVVTITPTYSGCPATRVIGLDIETALRGHGIDPLRIEQQLSPVWTTDWITPDGRAKLHEYGIAPPVDGTAADGRLQARVGALTGGRNFVVVCPRCGSGKTEKVS